MYLIFKNVLTFSKCVGLYRSPSRTKDESENFIKNLELNFDHIANKTPFLTAVLGDFSARMQG